MKRIILGFLLMCLTMTSGLHAAAKAGKCPVTLSWELVRNDAEKNCYECIFTLTNVSRETLGDDWALFFNQFPRRMTFPDKSPVEITEIVNSYYRLRPKTSFSLKPGRQARIEYTVRGSMKKISYAPDGGHFVPDSTQKALPLPIDHKPLRVGTFPQIPAYPTGERLYSLYASVNPTDTPSVLGCYDMLPAVKTVTVTDGEIDLSRKMAVYTLCDELEREKCYAVSELSERHLLADGKGMVKIGLQLLSRADARDDAAEANDEYYELDLSPEGITVRGVTRDAVLNGVKTLIQVIDHNRNAPLVPCAAINDWPDLHHRGMMLDIARNFSKYEDVKRLVGKLAEYKLNRFHFHFCDDEGWRLEIPGLPELTEVGSRRGYTLDENGGFMYQFYAGNGNPDDTTTTSNGYYTREQFIDLLRYADSRGIYILPEIESPGHARAAIRAMKTRYNRLIDTDPEAAEMYRLWDPADTTVYMSPQGYCDNTLNVAEEGVYRFMEKVVDELVLMYEEAGVEMPLFHVGGDEVARNPWAGSPDMQAFMEKHGLKTTHDAEEYYITRVAEMVASKGLKVAGWQEAALNHSKATDERLRPLFGGVYCWNTIPEWKDDELPYRVANNGYKVILCNVGNFYLDMAYNAHPMEPGLTWGGYVDEYRTWQARPYDIYHSTFETINGEPFDMEHIADGKQPLRNDARKNIVGVQGQVFAETIRTFDQVEYYVFPKIFGLAERGWNAELLPGQTIAKYNRIIGLAELPELQREGFNFRVGMPGIKVKDGKVWMNAAYPEAEIRYTADGSEPTRESTLWTQPVKVKGKVIKAKTFYLGKESLTTEEKL